MYDFDERLVRFEQRDAVLRDVIDVRQEQLRRSLRPAACTSADRFPDTPSPRRSVPPAARLIRAGIVTPAQVHRGNRHVGIERFEHLRAGGLQIERRLDDRHAGRERLLAPACRHHVSAVLKRIASSLSAAAERRPHDHAIRGDPEVGARGPRIDRLAAVWFSGRIDAAPSRQRLPAREEPVQIEPAGHHGNTNGQRQADRRNHEQQQQQDQRDRSAAAMAATGI